MGKPVTLPDALYTRLEQAAQAKGLTIEQLLTDLSAVLPSPTQTALLQVLSIGGLTPAPLGAFSDLIDPTVDYEAIRQALARKRFSPSLSETILTERG